MAFETKIRTPGTTNLSKPFRFEGLHFRRWKQKMFFCLTIKKFCLTKKPVFTEPISTENYKVLKEWGDKYFPCKNYILNGLSDELYDYYLQCKTQNKSEMLFRKNMIMKRLGLRNMMSDVI